MITTARHCLITDCVIPPEVLDGEDVDLSGDDKSPAEIAMINGMADFIRKMKTGPLPCLICATAIDRAHPPTGFSVLVSDGENPTALAGGLCPACAGGKHKALESKAREAWLRFTKPQH